MNRRISIFVRLLSVALISVGLGAAAFAAPQVRLNAPGASDGLRDDLRAASLLVQTRAEGVDDPQAYIAAAQADYARLLSVLYANARYGGVIVIRLDGREATTFSALSRIRELREVRIDVRPGPRYTFGAAIVGPQAPGTQLPGDFRTGGTASTEVIRDTAETTIDAWRMAGHAKARVADQDIVARHDADRVDARLALDPGPRLTFGRITVSGQSDVRTPRILKIAGLEEGRRFDPEELEQAAMRLRRTGSFSSVTIDEADKIGPGASLPLTIGVTDAVPRRFGFGAEISSIEGARLSAFWLHRNFLGGAERFRVDGSVSGLAGETGGVDLDFGVRYERPATPKADIDFFSEFRLESLDEPDFTSDTAEFSLGFTRYASERTTVNAGLGYLYSQTEDDFGAETIKLLTFPLGGTHDRRNDPLDPTSGFFVDLAVTPFFGLAGTSDGAQAKLDARGYVGTGAFTFAGRAQLGTLFGPSLEESPAFYRFYSGGGGTVRGQDYQSLGVDLGGLSVGGRSFLGLSGEVRADVGEDLQLVAFADWGYIGAESFPDFTGESHAGAGLGVRYQTGIGPLRLDVATPISGDTEASDFYIYIGIGQSF